jgi:glyoxalase-like protein
VLTVIDHVFVCTGLGAPAAEALREFGLKEGPPNTHPGQGTACRRFFFRNGMLELLWVRDPGEAQSDQTRRTRLWERWSEGGRGASPFGIILRPDSPAESAGPFQNFWEYRPASMSGLRLEIAEGTGLDEPMWCYMNTGRHLDFDLDHPCGFHELTGAGIVSPLLDGHSVTREMAAGHVIEWEEGDQHLLVLDFDQRRSGRERDFRPDLPVVFRW